MTRVIAVFVAVIVAFATSEVVCAQCVVPEPPGRCISDSDCLNGKTCDLTTNVCRCAAAAPDCAFSGGTWSCTSGHCAADNNAACSAPFSRSGTLCRCTADNQCGTGVCSNNICTCVTTPTPTATTTAATSTPTATQTAATPTPTPAPTPGGGDKAAQKCRAAIVTAGSVLLQSEGKALSACAGKVVSGKLPHGTTCRTEAKTAAAIGKATAKVASTVTKACGGKDKTCGSGNDDVPLADAGWQIASCPNVEGGTCTNAISDCTGIATCLTCIGEAAVDRAIGLYYDALVQTDPTDRAQKALNACQATIGRATTTFLGAKSKALAKCWQTVNAGKATGDCPAADGKATDAIAKAESKKVAAICKACGGADKACGGADDLTPAAIGFAPTCPAVDPPSGAPSCFGAIASLQDVVTCVDCVTEFEVDCATLAAVPGFAAYPPQCAPAVISRRRYKKNIEYLGAADLQRLHDELLKFHLASYRYAMSGTSPATFSYAISRTNSRVTDAYHSPGRSWL
jgi:hypothetical protein